MIFISEINFVKGIVGKVLLLKIMLVLLRLSLSNGESNESNGESNGSFNLLRNSLFTATHTIERVPKFIAEERSSSITKGLKGPTCQLSQICLFHSLTWRSSSQPRA